jgi:hypothetical protein
LHTYVPGELPAFWKEVARQYWDPFVQNRAPQANIPAGGVHPPLSEASWPAALARHALSYIWPSHAHTGSIGSVQTVGRGWHEVVERQSFLGELQN